MGNYLGFSATTKKGTHEEKYYGGSAIGHAWPAIVVHNLTCTGGYEGRRCSRAQVASGTVQGCKPSAKTLLLVPALQQRVVQQPPMDEIK